MKMVFALVWALAAGCATTQVRAPVAADVNDRCIHGVPCETCVKCHPELEKRFRAAGDWCPEHGVPETQCGLCHPEVIVPPPRPPEGADFQRLAAGGADVPSLEPLLSPGKVTLIDFYADWCGPCRRVDEHVFKLLETRHDLAYRKLDVATWETPLARHYLAGVASLPYVLVYARDGKAVGKMSGLALDELDRAIAAGAR